MQFSLTGFSQTTNVRRYTFQGVAADQTRQEATVGVDLNLARQYGISLQELPLLCQRFLEEQSAAGKMDSLTFSELEMLGVASRREEANREASKTQRRRRSE
jgi:hypothetical protein